MNVDPAVIKEYARAADQIVSFHFLLVVGIILYQLLLPVGLCFKAWWARNFWLRIIHFVIMGYIGYEGAIGQECPLTVWERGLRIAEMDDSTRARYYAWEYDPVNESPPFAQFAHRALFYRLEPDAFASLNLSVSSFFHWVHIVFGLIVVLTLVLGPPDWPWRQKKIKSKEPTPQTPPANPS